MRNETQTEGDIWIMMYVPKLNQSLEISVIRILKLLSLLHQAGTT